MKDIKQVSFPYKGEILQGTIKRMNKKTVTVETSTLTFRVPYSLLTPKMKPPKQKPKQSAREWSSSQTGDYEKSQNTAIQLIPNRNAKILHIAVKFLAEALKNGDEEAIKEYSNETVAELNRIYKLPQLSVYTGGKRRLTRRGGQYYGVYKSRGEEVKRHSISVYSRTAKTQKYVAPKTFLRTLIHEWGHHYDKYKLKISNTYHTKGFYDRIKTIYTELKKPLD
ncbi:MAG: hypothetical protein GOP50_11755 [Candidatus Heimdallarchaeota archaeon]|nr:hypothetical protein [Candidatus Heimdallarchaeota archaeon]